jgi:hypothetical protein
MRIAMSDALAAALSGADAATCRHATRRAGDAAPGAPAAATSAELAEALGPVVEGLSGYDAAPQRDSLTA